MSFATYSSYVSFTSYKKDGTPVSLPVWIVQLADGKYAFETEAHSFKVKRIRNNPAVEIRPCNIRGKVAPDAPVLRGNAYFTTEESEVKQVVEALKNKYGIRVHAINAFYYLFSKCSKGKYSNENGAVIITIEQ